MPIKKSAKKALRQNKKRAERNKKIKLNIKYLTKKCLKAIEAKDKTKALEWYKKAQKAIDKAAKVNVLKKNTAARKKSQLMTKINTLGKEGAKN